MTKVSEARIANLLDREDIRDLIREYSRAVDRRDRDLLASLYWPDGSDIHGSFDGTAPDFVEYAIWSVGRDRRTHHVMGETLLEFEEPRALGETYFISYHLRAPEGGNPYDEAFGGRYLDIFEKRADEWRIFRRMLVIDWCRRYQDTVDWEATHFKTQKGATLRLSERKPDDPLYAHYDLLRARADG
jgi:ketosteroid isomerase-like protein